MTQYVCVCCAEYVAVTVGDSCPGGTTTITSTAECEWAAEALRTQTHETDMSADYKDINPNRKSEGCGYTHGFLYFYPNADGSCSKWFGHTCLCRVTEVAVTATLDDSDDDDDDDDDDSKSDSCDTRCTFASLIPVVMPIVGLLGIIVTFFGCLFCCKKAGICCFRKQQVCADE